MNIILSIATILNILPAVLFLIPSFQFFPFLFEFNLVKSYGFKWEFHDKSENKEKLKQQHVTIIRRVLHPNMIRENKSNFIIASNDSKSFQKVLPVLHYQMKWLSRSKYEYFFEEKIILGHLARYALNMKGFVFQPERELGRSSPRPRLSRFPFSWATERQIIKTIEHGRSYTDLREKRIFNFLESDDGSMRNILIERDGEGGFKNIKVGLLFPKQWWVEAIPRNNAIFRRLQKRYFERLKKEKEKCPTKRSSGN